METVNLARLLMGGDRSNSAFSVFVDRCMMFCSQPIYLDEERYWGMFYERLRNPFEVVVALAVGSAINQQEVPFEHGLLVPSWRQDVSELLRRSAGKSPNA